MKSEPTAQLAGSAAGHSHIEPAVGSSSLLLNALLALAMAFILLLVGFLAWIRADFAATGQHARSNLEAATLLLEQQVQQSLSNIDRVLIETARLASQTGLGGLRAPAFRQQLHALAARLPESGAIFIYDRQGDTVIASRGDPTPSFNARDRDYFRHLLAGGSEPYIGQALQGQTVHKLFFPVARAIRSAKGELLGIAQVGVDVAHIGDSFRYAGLATGMNFGLYRSHDGALVARQPMHPEMLGETIAAEDFFARLAADGSYWIGQPADQAGETLLAARHVRSLPLVVTATLSPEQLYTQTHASLLWRSAALGLALAILGLLGALWLRSLRQERQAHRQMARSEKNLRDTQARLHLALDAAYVISFEWDIQRNEVRRHHSSDAALSATEPDQPSSFEAVCAAVHPDDRERFIANVETARNSADGHYENEFRVVHPDGQVAWLYERGLVERDAQGQAIRLIGISQDITWRKQQAAALEASEELNRMTLHALPAHIAVCDPQGRIITVNQAWNDFAACNSACEVAGVGVGANYLEVCRDAVASGDADAAAVLAGIEAVAAGEQPSFSLDYPCDSPDQAHWFHMTVVPLGSGKQRGLVVAHIDITERKLTEAALERSEADHRLLLEQAPDGIFLADARGHYLEVNQAGAKMLGYSREEILGMSIPDIIIPEETPRVPAELVRYKDGSITAAEWQFRRKDGSTFLGEVVGRQFPDGRLQGILRDISERRRVEIALRESELFYRQTLESIPGMVFTTRADGYCDYQSRQWEVYTGIAMAEHLGDGWNRLLHPEDQPRALDAWNAAVAGRAPYELEYRVRRADGVYEWFG
jgi:PAS domain S-box-containing protein